MQLSMWRQLDSSNQLCAAITNYCATDLDISLSFQLCAAIMNIVLMKMATDNFFVSLISFS